MPVFKQPHNHQTDENFPKIINSSTPKLASSSWHSLGAGGEARGQASHVQTHTLQTIPSSAYPQPPCAHLKLHLQHIMCTSAIDSAVTSAWHPVHSLWRWAALVAPPPAGAFVLAPIISHRRQARFQASPADLDNLVWPGAFVLRGQLNPCLFPTAESFCTQFQWGVLTVRQLQHPLMAASLLYLPLASHPPRGEIISLQQLQSSSKISRCPCGGAGGQISPSKRSPEEIHVACLG